MGFLKKLADPRIIRRVLVERLSEPLHLNFIALWVAVFGSFRQRVNFDLILRQHNAFGILSAAERARLQGLKKITVIEFGVAAGAGLINMCRIALRVSKATGVEIRVIGFDSGTGMPPSCGYRDHPDLYQAGDFPMDFAALRAKLPPNGELILGQLKDSVPEFIKTRLNSSEPIGYVVVDVDYYSSTVEALKIFNGPSESYLPLTILYLDDIGEDHHNSFAGELLAVQEFNAANALRKACKHDFFECRRVFRRANWLKHIYFLHVMDHPIRANDGASRSPQRVITNPYIS
jgi:hypothetical protein